VYQDIVRAVNAAVEYTRWATDRTEADFRKTIEKLSTAIDTLRGVFENVPRKRYPLGIYPYESIKDIQLIIGWLGYGERWRSEKDRARKYITKLWGSCIIRFCRSSTKVSRSQLKVDSGG